jgi:hypothetical protein
MIQQRHPYTDIHCSIIHIAKLWKQPRYPTTDEWIKKLWYIHTMEYYSAKRNNDMGFKSKWKIPCKSQDKKHKGSMFLSYVEDRSKGIYRNKHDHIQIQM